MDELSVAISKVAQLETQDKLELAAQLYGFRSVPPTIDEFIDDPRYLGTILGGGKVYPYWREQLRDVYPNPIFSKYKYIVPKGAIGTGKSTFSMLCAGYDACRMLHLKNPHATIQLAKGTMFTFRCFNLTKDKAHEVLIGPLSEWMRNSPFFREELDAIAKGYRYNTDIRFLPARRANDVISECLVFSLISEVNFFKKPVAKDIITTCNSRMTSRLQMVDNVFGKIILDSSSTETDSVVEEFIRECPDPSRLKVINTSIWDAKKHLNIYFNKGSFRVYAGSDGIPPHIIGDDEDTSKFDQDRIVIAPKELEDNFRFDIIKSLNDQAGYSISDVNEFITDKSSIIRALSLDPVIPDEDFVIDFFDEEQIYDRIGSNILSVLPSDRKIYCRTDLGLVQDRAGMAISYIDSAKFDNIGGKKIFRPHIVCPVAFGISRKPGQETSIEKIINFWVWLSTKRQVAIVTLDQFQSSAINQELTKLGIKNKRLSVDRTDSAYVEMKNLMLQDRIKLVKTETVQSELWNLIRVGNKVDHKSSSTKDVCDAIVGTVQTIIEDGSASADITNDMMFDNFNDALSELKASREMNRYRFLR
jgi:hypothetical protein